MYTDPLYSDVPIILAYLSDETCCFSDNLTICCQIRRQMAASGKLILFGRGGARNRVKGALFRGIDPG